MFTTEQREKAVGLYLSGKYDNHYQVCDELGYPAYSTLPCWVRDARKNGAVGGPAVTAEPKKLYPYAVKAKAVGMAREGRLTQAEIADELGTKYNVEMQNVNKYDLARRSRYYLTANDIDCIRKGTLYSKMNDTYVIFICKFDPLKCGLPVYTVTPHCKETGNEMPDGATRLFLSTVAWHRCENPRLRSFLRYVDEGMIDEENDDSGFLLKVDETVHSIRRQKEWRIKYMRMMNELNQQFAEGKAEGKAEMNEENRLLSERLAADGRESEANAIFGNSERRSRELERYGIVSPAEPAVR